AETEPARADAEQARAETKQARADAELARAETKQTRACCLSAKEQARANAQQECEKLVAVVASQQREQAKLDKDTAATLRQAGAEARASTEDARKELVALQQQAELYTEDLGKACAEAKQAQADAERVLAEAHGTCLVLKKEVEKAQHNGNQLQLQCNRKKETGHRGYSCCCCSCSLQGNGTTVVGVPPTFFR
ncbi:MAG: hypothetical protein AB2556_26190, partial [Candidatus Thiodiazotropha sp.]